MADSSNAKVDFSEAKVYEEMGLYSESLAAFKKVLSEHGDSDPALASEINEHIDRLQKIVDDDSDGVLDQDAFSREAMGEIKTQAADDKDIAPILDRASVFLEKGLYDEAADEYAMLFSIGYSYDSIIPPMVDFLKTFCQYGQWGHELAKVIDKFNVDAHELAEIYAQFGLETGKQGQYSSAIGLLEKAKTLDPDNEEIDATYTDVIEQFLAEGVNTYLLKRTRLTQGQLVEALKSSYNEKVSLYQELLNKKLFEKERLLKALEDYYKLKTVQFDPELTPPHRLISRVDKEVLYCQGWVPLEMGPMTFRVALDNPDDQSRKEQIQRRLGVDDIEYYVAIQEDVLEITNHFFAIAMESVGIVGDRQSSDEGDDVVLDIVDMIERKNGWDHENKMPMRPKLISAEVIVDGKSDKPDSMVVRLKDSKKSGFGILVSSEEYEQLNQVKSGDMINDIIFYAGWAMIRTKSVVSKVTRINEGIDKGHYFLEVESDDVV